MDNLDLLFEKIENLRLKISEKGKLSADILRKIDYHFRLECNYFSNRMEGNTLSKQETRSVMVDNIRVADKSLKEILEMQGHDKVMLDILKIGRGELSISEKRIKEIHRSIIYEVEPKNQSQIGNWKTTNNEIINSKFEKYQFLPADEVAEAMHNLLNFLNAESEKINRKDKKAKHPIQLSAEFHLKILAIHPFFDGNGRIARLLSNLILISTGFPPFYILDEEKDTYNRLITDVQSYGGHHDLFVQFIAQTVVRSLENMLQLTDNQ